MRKRSLVELAALVALVGWILSTCSWQAVKAQPVKPFVLTETEQLKLDTLRLRRRAVEAEYRQQLAELLIDEQQYSGQVQAAHPDANMIFDPQSVSWIRRVGPVGASGGR